MRKAINIENSNNNVVRVLSIANETVIEGNPTGLIYILITDYVEPPVLSNPLSVNYAMYDKVNKAFKWVQIQYQNTATEEMLNIENLKLELGNVKNNVTKIDSTVFPVADKTNLQKYMEYRVNESKDLLSEYLQNNHLLFNGKYYSVTQEKQNLLNNALAVYQMKVQAGLPAELKWNSTGETCTVWTLTDLSALALAISKYVEPLVSKQQTLEVQIKACTTIKELEAIVIDYAKA